MSYEYLIHPITLEIAAQIEAGRQVIIYDPEIKRSTQLCGIAIPPDRRRQFQGRWYIYYDDPDQALFAIAFKEFKYPRGLAQQGFKWQNQTTPNRLSDVIQEFFVKSEKEE